MKPMSLCLHGQRFAGWGTFREVLRPGSGPWGSVTTEIPATEFKPAGSLVLSNRNVSAASYLLVQAASGNLAATVFWEGPRVAFSIIWVVPPGTDVKKSFRIFWSHFHFYIIRMDDDRRSPRVINHGLAVHSFICQLNLSSRKERVKWRNSLGSQVTGWRTEPWSELRLNSGSFLDPEKWA